MFSVAVPEAEIPTVTAWYVGLLNVPVRVTADPSSSMEDADEASVNVGAESSLVIVIVCCCVPFSVAPPPETDDISVIIVSLVSYVMSLIGLS